MKRRVEIVVYERERIIVRNQRWISPDCFPLPSAGTEPPTTVEAPFENETHAENHSTAGKPNTEAAAHERGAGKSSIVRTPSGGEK